MGLTRRQREAFDRDGVVGLGQVLTPDEASYLAARLNALIADAHALLPQRRELGATLDGGHHGSVLQMVNLYQADEAFRDVVFRADLLEMACELLGPRVRLFRDQVFFKPAGIGGEVYMHQDNRYWHLNPPLAVTVWIALDDVTVSNGCVHFVHGSHRLGRVDHERALGGRSVLLEAVADKTRAVPLPLALGSASVHHCQVLHWSPENHSPFVRRGYTIQYMAADVLHRGAPADEFPLVCGGRSPSS